MGKGRSLELYFIDGKPDGMLTAEVFNWTGHVLKAPRGSIFEALKLEEAKYTGVYILLDTETGTKAYIGESENTGKRIAEHVKAKDWWDTAILITTTANNLNKAHVKYLESRLHEMAMATKRIPLDNGNQPPRPSLSRAATANMEEFLDNLMMVLPAIQVDMFVNKALEISAPKQPPRDFAFPLFELSTPKHSVMATAELRDGEMVVLAGSVARARWPRSHGQNKGYQQLHSDLIDLEMLKVSGDHAVFATDFAFSSPSAAAAILNGRAANGRTEWKLKGTNKTYADWEAEQIEKDD